jgi:hypothetical protein
MHPIPQIKKSVVLLVTTAALVVPTAATAYPVIGDDPGTPAASAEGKAWYAALLMRQHTTLKPRPKPVIKPTSTCHPKSSKKACPLR